MATDVSVLVVEDDASIADTLALVLRQEGYAPTFAASFPDALAQLDAKTFHLVITDVLDTTPQHGIPLTHMLQQRAFPIPTVILSAWRLAADLPGREDFAFVLEKPFQLDDLLASVAAALALPFTDQHLRQGAAVLRFFAALEHQDEEALRHLCTPDLDYLAEGAPVPVEGREAYIAYMQAMVKRYPQAHFLEVLPYAMPKGIAARFIVQWITDQGPAQAGGGVVFHFSGDQDEEEQIRQIGVERVPKVDGSSGTHNEQMEYGQGE